MADFGEGRIAEELEQAKERKLRHAELQRARSRKPTSACSEGIAQQTALEEMEGESWACVTVRHHAERTLAGFCRSRQIRYFLPEIGYMQAARGGEKWKEQALFPEYLFCSLNRETYHSVKELPFVRRIDWLKSSSELAQLREIESAIGTTRPDSGTAADSQVPVERTELIRAVDAINAELIKILAKHPSYLYELSPARFEELVAELLRDMGFDVCLTPATRDGGRDILAIFKIPTGQTLTVVECKRYAPGRKIGPDIIERLLWVADAKDKASRAMVATTSFFSSGALNLQNQYQWKLALKDFGDISDWLQSYGKWASRSTGGIWIPYKGNAVQSRASDGRPDSL